MSVQHCRIILILMAMIVGGATILTPGNSTSHAQNQDDRSADTTHGSAIDATQIPVLWSAGGLSAGVDSAGQSARIASDASGNIAVVSGPAYARFLAVTSYTASGIQRWRRTVEPDLGVFVGDWIVAAPNGDFIAIGHNQDSHGRPIQSTMVRYDTNGTLLWRVDFSSGFYPVVGRLVVDSSGNAYLTWSATGSGLFVQKYSPSGVLLWSRGSSNGGIYAIATSLALSPDETDVIATGDISGGAMWITAAFNTTTGIPRWEVSAPEGIANLDVVVDASRVYVTGQGNVGTSGFLTVVAYDRATGARLWRTDANPPVCCAYATRIAKAPDGSLVVAGRMSSGGYFDWWIVSFNTNGNVRWQARRDAALSGDEMPAAVFVLADGTTVVSGVGGPVIRDILGNQYMQGVTAGYSPNGTLLWEAFSRLPTVWAASLPNGDVCATGGYDALITCFRPSGGVLPNLPPIAVMSANPLSGPAPLTVTFDGSGSTDPDGSVTSWIWSFGDGSSGTGAVVTHTYTTIGITYYPSLTVVDNRGASTWIAGSPIQVNAPPPPAAPSLLTASISGASVVLNWRDNASDEIGFYVERCEGVGCTDFIGLFGDTTANVTTFTDSSVVAGTTYGYRVVAYNAGGYSGYSNIASIMAGTSNQPPIAVMSITPATGPAPLNVVFDGSGSTDPDGTVTSWAWSFGDGAFGTGPQATHLYTTPGTYTASLTVTDNSSASNTTTGSIVVDAVILAAPGNLVAQTYSKRQINLTWVNNNSKQDGVKIERCMGTNCTTFTQIADVAGNATSYANSGLVANVTYRYRVRAYISAGNSPYSNTASAKTVVR